MNKENIKNLLVINLLSLPTLVKLSLNSISISAIDK